MGTEVVSLKKNRVDANETSLSERKGSMGKSCLGNPLNKYDIDEIVAQNDKGDKLDQLASLSLLIPENQKSLRMTSQVPRNAQGKRVFHGAFTGGFTAGYNNTVGSAEGWRPATFSSSQKKRATALQSRVEDFMDDQDVEDMMSGHLPSAIFSSSHQKDIPLPQCTEDEHPFKADAAEFLLLPGTSLGHRILRSLGWREGTKSVMTSTPLRPPVLQPKRRYGPEIPASLRHSTASEVVKQPNSQDPDYDDNFSWSWIERRQGMFDQLFNYCQRIREVSNRNYAGLGYKNSRLDLRNKMKSLSSRSHRAFGFGVGHDEDDEKEEDDDDDTERTEDFLCRAELCDESYAQGCPQNIVFVDASKKESDSISHHQACFKHLEILKDCRIPENFLGIYTPGEAELQHNIALHRGLITGVVAALVEHFQKQNPKLSGANPLQAIPQAPKEEELQKSKPLWSSITPEAKDMLLKSLSVNTRFFSPGESTQYENLTYVNDKEKQRRYDYFCLALEEKIRPSLVFNLQKCLTTEEAERERQEFSQQYRQFRQRFPTVKLREVHLTCDSPSLTTAPISRVVIDWDPTRVVCQLYRVPYPFQKKEFVDQREKLQTALCDSNLRKNSDSKIVSSRSLINSVIHLMSNDSNHLPGEKHQDSAIPCPEPQAPFTSVRPPLSIFKSVFGDEDFETTELAH